MTGRLTGIILLVVILMGVGLAPVYAVPAFPGAEGFGANTVGGRGGKVIEVTNLSDSGTGSLRACMTATGPRTCVFRVAGNITLNSWIEVRSPNLTVAGQTAPGGGITVRVSNQSEHGTLKIYENEVILRYLRFRPGPASNPSGGETADVDAITIAKSNNQGTIQNIILDHISTSWSRDETVNTWYDVRNFTMQWNFSYEGLSQPYGLPEHSKGPLFGSDRAHNLSIHHNLFTHNLGRNPAVKTSTLGPVELVNNVVMANNEIAMWSGGDTYSNGNIPLNIIGNYVEFTPGCCGAARGFWALNGNPSIYLEGNSDNHMIQGNQSTFVRGSFTPHARYAVPVPVTATSAQMAFNQVLAEGGATLGLNPDGTFFRRRDLTDEKIVLEVQNNNFGPNKVIDLPTESCWAPGQCGYPPLSPGMPYSDIDRDGMSDSWEIMHFGNTSRGSAVNSSADFDGDGYTDLEEFLNGTNPKVRDTGGSAPTPGPASPTLTTTAGSLIRWSALLAKIYMTGIVEDRNGDSKLNLLDWLRF